MVFVYEIRMISANFRKKTRGRNRTVKGKKKKEQQNLFVLTER